MTATVAADRTPSRRELLVRRRATPTGRVVEYALAVTLVGVVYYAAGRVGLALAYLDGAVAPSGLRSASASPRSSSTGFASGPGSPSPISS